MTSPGAARSGQVAHDASEPDRFAGEIGADQRLALRRGVAFVEDEVDDREDRVEALGHVGRLGHDVGDAGDADLLLRPHQPLRHRRRRHEEGAGDRLGVEAAQRPQRQRDLGVDRQRRMTAREDQPQPVVGDVVGVVVGLVDRAQERRIAMQLDLGGESRLASHAIERLVPRGLDDPRPRELRHAARAPLLDRRRERLLRRLLRQIEVAGQPDQRRDDAAPVLAIEIADGGIDAHDQSSIIENPARRRRTLLVAAHPATI